MVVVCSHVVDVGPLVDEELDGAEVPRPGGFHERGTATLCLMLQIRSGAEQHVGHIRVTVFAGVRQGRISSSGLSVDISSGLRRES